MTRLLFLIPLILILSIDITAQQDPMYSQYAFNGMVINPAYAGSGEVLSASLLYRNQWVNVPGAPKNGLIAIDGPLRNERVGLGFLTEFDKIGVTSHTGISGIYSFKIKFVKSSLSFGLQGGVGFNNSLFTSVKYSEQTNVDQAFINNIRDVIPNFGFGLYYNADRFFAGFSIPQIAGKSLQKLIYGNYEMAHLDLANHYFVSSGYRFDLSPDVSLKPSVLLKYVNGAPMEMDINGVATFYDLVALGFSYRSMASMNILAQARITNQLYVGYAYEYATTDLNTFSSGSHEIMLQYHFDFSTAKIVTPRFF